MQAPPSACIARCRVQGPSILMVSVVKARALLSLAGQVGAPKWTALLWLWVSGMQTGP